MSHLATVPIEDIIAQPTRPLASGGRRCIVCGAVLARQNPGMQCMRAHSLEEKRAAVARMEHAARAQVLAGETPYIPRRPTPKELLEFCALESRVQVGQLSGVLKRRKGSSKTSVRTIALYLLATDLKLVQKEIAELLRLSRQSSVSHGINHISRKVAEWDMEIIDLIIRIRSHYRRH